PGAVRGLTLRRAAYRAALGFAAPPDVRRDARVRRGQLRVTVRHGSLMSHAGLRTRCERTPRLLAKGRGYVLYALMDFIVDQYRPIVQRLEEEGQEVEEGILDGALGVGAT